MKLLCLNGPNLNRLGKREPHIYGHETLDDVRENVQNLAASLGATVEFRQSNHEGVLVDWVHEAEDENYDGIIFNPVHIPIQASRYMMRLQVFLCQLSKYIFPISTNVRLSDIIPILLRPALVKFVD